MSTILEVKKTVEDILLLREDVIGVGITPDRQTIRIYINTDDLTQELPPLPDRISGFPVEIVPVPGFDSVMKTGFRSYRYRPVVGGISASHPMVTAGTVGAVITDRATGRKLLLSNNHVFANTDSDGHPGATEGDPIYQPGVVDGGDETDMIATLYRWIPLSDKKLNLVDAALAMPIDQNIASSYILANDHNEMIRIRGIKSVSSPITVKKYGRTTGMNRGRVLDFDFSVAIDYDDGKTRNFADQILVEMDIQGGDSGAVLLDDENYAVGLVCAGGMDSSGRWFGVANKIRNVLAMLGSDVDIVDGWIETSVSEPFPNVMVEEKVFGHVGNL